MRFIFMKGSIMRLVFVSLIAAATLMACGKSSSKRPKEPTVEPSPIPRGPVGSPTPEAQTKPDAAPPTTPSATTINLEEIAGHHMIFKADLDLLKAERQEYQSMAGTAYETKYVLYTAAFADQTPVSVKSISQDLKGCAFSINAAYGSEPQQLLITKDSHWRETSQTKYEISNSSTIGITYQTASSLQILHMTCRNARDVTAILVQVGHLADFVKE